MKRVLVIYGLVISLSAALCAAADVSGLWTGTIDIKDEGSGTTITTPVRIQIAQESAAISGKIGRPEDPQEVPIKNVHMEGNTISFEASNGETAGPAKFVLTVDGDRMEGDMKVALDTEPLNGKVRVTRAAKK